MAIEPLSTKVIYHSSAMSRKFLFRLSKQYIHRQRRVFLSFHRASFFDSGMQIYGFSYYWCSANNSRTSSNASSISRGIIWASWSSTAKAFNSTISPEDLSGRQCTNLPFVALNNFWLSLPVSCQSGHRLEIDNIALKNTFRQHGSEFHPGLPRADEIEP